MLFNRLNLENIDILKNKYGLSTLAAKVLSSMNLDDATIDEIFLSTKTLNDIDVTLFTSLTERIKHAKEHNEKVLICGDYDCDGVCATAILYDALQSYGLQCGFYIPDRFKQGYGLHVDTVDMAHDKGYTLLITVDNGVKAQEALMKAKYYGIDIILTDHHSYIDEELIYDYFLHPNILPPFYQNMCGAGVALLIARCLVGNNDKHTMLAGIATIGDVVPLLRLNRIIVKEAIRLLNRNPLLSVAKLANDKNVWDEKKIAFQIVPKINCAGRMADLANANNLVRYLLSDNEVQLDRMATQINQINDIRKDLSQTMETAALNKVSNNNQFHILYDASFYEGINGIVASRLVNKLQKPVMILSGHDSILKGSIRSNSVNLTAFFDDIKEYLIAYGGHKEAAGISFNKDKLDFIQSYANNKLKDYTFEATVDVIELEKDEISIEALESLECLKPFGCGFQMPEFLISDHNIKVQKLGNGSHLKYSGDKITYLFFNQKERYCKDSNTDRFNFVGQLEINNFRNQKSINMIVNYIEE